MVSVGMPGLTIHDAIGLAISIITPWNSFVPGTIPDRRREPTWHDPNTLLRIAASQAFSHRSDIVAAFSTGSRTFQDLPRFRNYFAHRNDDTLKVARNAAPLYGIPRALKPSEILMSTPLNASEALIIIMIDDIVFTAEYLCA